MSLIACRVVTVADAAAVAAYRGRMGDVVIADDLSGGGIVTNPAAAPEAIGGGYIPSGDNTTDLGDATHRFRSLYLGTSIKNAGDLAVELSGGATRTLSVTNPTGGQVAQISTDGNVSAAVSLNTPKWTSAGNAEIDLTGGAPRTLTIRNSGGSVCNAEVTGSLTVGTNAIFTQRAGGEANLYVGATEVARATATRASLPDQVTFLADSSVIYERFAAGSVRWTIGGGGVMELTATSVAVQIDLALSSVNPAILATAGNATITITPNGTGAVQLRGGDSSVKVSVGTDGFALYGGARVPRAAAIPDPTGGGTVDTECRAAVAALLAAVRSGTGINLIAP